MINKYIQHLLYILFILCMIISCKEDNRLLHTLKEIKSMPIKLHLDKMQCKYKGKDTLLTNITKPCLRLVKYIDSTECSPCILDHMHYWNTLIDETKQNENKVQYIFIVAPKAEDLENTYLSIQYGGLRNPIYVDTAYIFRKNNPVIIGKSIYHTFLLNERDSIILVGDPLESMEIKELFKKTIDY